MKSQVTSMMRKGKTKDMTKKAYAPDADKQPLTHGFSGRNTVGHKLSLQVRQSFFGTDVLKDEARHGSASAHTMVHAELGAGNVDNGP